MYGCQETLCLKQARHLKVQICKVFADDTSIFSHISDKYISQSESNNDLQASNWPLNGKCNLKVHQCRFGNLPVCSYSSKNTTLKT